MSLKDQGFRFIRREPVYMWVHAADVLATDTDCTDMTDKEFLEFFDKCKRNQADRQPRQDQNQ